MTALGGDVSGGAVKLVGMFKSMSTATDSLGDLGMLNNELLQTYAQYMETQRLTGALDRKLANNGAREDVNRNLPSEPEMPLVKSH